MAELPSDPIVGDGVVLRPFRDADIDDMRSRRTTRRHSASCRCFRRPTPERTPAHWIAHARAGDVGGRRRSPPRGRRPGDRPAARRRSGCGATRPGRPRDQHRLLGRAVGPRQRRRHRRHPRRSRAGRSTHGFGRDRADHRPRERGAASGSRSRPASRTRGYAGRPAPPATAPWRDLRGLVPAGERLG